MLAGSVVKSRGPTLVSQKTLGSIQPAPEFLATSDTGSHKHRHPHRHGHINIGRIKNRELVEG